MAALYRRVAARRRNRCGAHKWGTWFRMSLQLVRAAMFRQAVTVERTIITQDMTHVYLNQKKVGTKTLSFIAAQAAGEPTFLDGRFRRGEKPVPRGKQQMTKHLTGVPPVSSTY